MSFHRFYAGHVMDCLRQLPDRSVNCMVTSPLYFSLRDYGLAPVMWPDVSYYPMPWLPEFNVPRWEGQLGLEPDPIMFVGHLVYVFREVWRVLRKDGVLFLNMGDGYAQDVWRSHRGYGKHTRAKSADVTGRVSRVTGYKPKDLLGLPWALASALRQDGWYLRQEIIWDKPNAMPEAVTDRPTRAHETVFLLTKTRHYWYDKDAISEPMLCPEASTPEDLARAMTRRRATMPRPRQAARRPAADMPLMRNARSVWRIPTGASCEGVHFAVFPPELAEKCILSGCPPYLCSVCGRPYVREVVKTGHVNQREAAHVPGNQGTKTDSTGWAPTTLATDRFVPACQCEGIRPVPGTVLDPFGGSGTVTWAAMKHERNSVYGDLSSEYLDLALARCGFSGPRLLDCHEFEVVRLDGAGGISGEEVVQR